MEQLYEVLKSGQAVEFDFYQSHFAVELLKYCAKEKNCIATLEWTEKEKWSVNLLINLV